MKIEKGRDRWMIGYWMKWGRNQNQIAQKGGGGIEKN